MLSELSEVLNQPKVPVKAKGKTTKARVLTSAESLSLPIEKERKRRMKQKQSKKRRERRSGKKKRLKSKVKLGIKGKKVAKKPSMSKDQPKRPVASLQIQTAKMKMKSRLTNVLFVSAYTKMIFFPLVNYSLNGLSVPILLVRSGCIFSVYS